MHISQTIKKRLRKNYPSVLKKLYVILALKTEKISNVWERDPLSVILVSTKSS